jgi:DNA-directed RNA polymerase alpha subunit
VTLDPRILHESVRANDARERIACALERLVDLLDPPSAPERRVPAWEPASADDVLIEELELGVRAYNCLKRAGVQTLSQLQRATEKELRSIPNLGQATLREIQRRVAEFERERRKQ